MLEHDELRRILPQRFPMLLVDRVIGEEPAGVLVAEKAVTAAEPCYRNLPDDAAPADFAYPEALLIESFGQAAALAWLGRHDSIPTAELPVFAAARDITFVADVFPGDTVRHVVHIVQRLDGAAYAGGDMWVGERRIATVGSLLAVVRPESALTGRAEQGPDTVTQSSEGRGNDGRNQ
ncbi:3-hydroxyacyl-ACP dehydratase FabZ family protein [Nocardia sp. NPDC051321]|uniref:3-hydroxyacyl-ACP dehydratase FabZ family protein n=1 Tax=Nocardia sp. NPDC051321 TaxID=3364323 RepID=UPI00378A5F2A